MDFSDYDSQEFLSLPLLICTWILKNQGGEIKFNKRIFSLQKSLSKSIFAGYTGNKNPVRNRLKIQFAEHEIPN